MRSIVFLMIVATVLVNCVQARDGIKSSSLDHAIEEGKATFLHFCSVCHGKDGKSGDLSLYKLKKQPPNLTLISSKNNGTFPWLNLFKIINGQESINAHKSSEMPDWGYLLDLRNWGDEENDEFAEEIVYGRLFVLLVYLNSIQDKSASE